jgi:hypothetical protein
VSYQDRYLETSAIVESATQTASLCHWPAPVGARRRAWPSAAGRTARVARRLAARQLCTRSLRTRRRSAQAGARSTSTSRAIRWPLAHASMSCHSSMHHRQVCVLHRLVSGLLITTTCSHVALSTANELTATRDFFSRTAVIVDDTSDRCRSCARPHFVGVERRRDRQAYHLVFAKINK